MLISSATLFEGNLYWSEMKTIIYEGKSEGTGGDRWLLMGKAWEIFLDYPLVGVGPRNYGHVLPQYATTEFRAGYHTYGRVPHNIYFQLLAETGVLGVAAFFVLVYYFFKNNAQIRQLRNNSKVSVVNGAYGNQKYFELNKAQYLSLALETGMVAYLLNAFFYDLLYCSWFFDLIIINQLVYRNSLGMKSRSE